MKKYNNLKFGFEILIPNTWKIEETQQIDFLNLQFTVPFSDASSVIFVVVEKLPSQVSVEKYKNRALNAIKNIGKIHILIIGMQVSLESEKNFSKPFEYCELLMKQTGTPEKKDSKEQSMIWSRLFIQGKRGFNIQFRESFENVKNFLEITRKVFDQMKIFDENSKKLEVTESDYVQVSLENLHWVIQYPLHFIQTRSNASLLMGLLDKVETEHKWGVLLNEDSSFGFSYVKCLSKSLKSDLEKICNENSIKVKIEENENELKILLIKGSTSNDLKMEHSIVYKVKIGEESYYGIGYGNSNLNRLIESFKFIVSHTKYDKNAKNSLLYINNDEKISFPIPEDYVIEMDSKALNFTQYSKTKENYNPFLHRMSLSLMKTSLSLDDVKEKVEKEMKPFTKKNDMIYIKILSEKKIKIGGNNGYEIRWDLINNTPLMTGIGLTLKQSMNLSFCFLQEGRLLHIKQVCVEEEFDSKKSFIEGFTETIQIKNKN